MEKTDPRIEPREQGVREGPRRPYERPAVEEEERFQTFTLRCQYQTAHPACYPNNPSP